MTDPLHSNSLVPFKKRRNAYILPGGAGEHEERLTSQVDELSAEEQGFVRHYLRYADTLLRSAAQESSSGSENQAAMPVSGQEERHDSEDRAA